MRAIRSVGKFVRGRLRSAVINTAPNAILNRISDFRPLSWEELQCLQNVDFGILQIDSSRYVEFVEQYFPGWQRYFVDAFYKKLLEFYASFSLLDILPTDVYLDAAGGVFTYAGRVQAARRLLHDRFVSQDLKDSLSAAGVEVIESDAECIQLPDSSVDKISTHHSFEHFRGETDTRFVQEVQRILRPGGRACIVPVFVAPIYCEIVDSIWTPHSDLRARRVYDPTSPFPGGRYSGQFARVYGIEAFEKRVLNVVDRTKFAVRFFELRMGSEPLPDQRLNCHRTDPRIDFPYRALLIERKE